MSPQSFPDLRPSAQIIRMSFGIRDTLIQKRLFLFRDRHLFRGKRGPEKPHQLQPLGYAELPYA